MAGITQTIPQYSLGISEQPDNLKFPGQVTDSLNAIPDVTKGLFKRPGSKRIGTNALSSVQSGGSWFHYFRDESEGSYIGQIAADGQVRVWRCSDGTLMTTAYGTGGQTAITNYLATSTPENIQTLTINDTTFATNRDTTNSNTLIGTTGTTDATPDAHFAFLELLRTENGRQYGVNVSNNSNVQTLNRATRIEIQSDNLDESDGTGHCPGIGTQVFSKDSGSKTNLIFRLNILGQQGVSPNYGANQNGAGGQDYRCSYNREAVLLHGGEGFVTNDTVTATLDSAAGGADTNGNGTPDAAATYTVKVVDHESTSVQANLGLIRPAPTPFDAQTAVTADSILGSLKEGKPLGTFPTKLTPKFSKLKK